MQARRMSPAGTLLLIALIAGCAEQSPDKVMRECRIDILYARAPGPFSHSGIKMEALPRLVFNGAKYKMDSSPETEFVNFPSTLSEEAFPKNTTVFVSGPCRFRGQIDGGVVKLDYLEHLASSQAE